MTYEKFKEAVLTDTSKSEKDVRKFTVNYALLLFLSALSTSMVIQNILGVGFSLVFLLLVLFLFIWSFDLIVETQDRFNKWNKFVKFWWLITPMVLALCLFINYLV